MLLPVWRGILRGRFNGLINGGLWGGRGRYISIDSRIFERGIIQGAYTVRGGAARVPERFKRMTIPWVNTYPPRRICF